ncbi:hypothetical protein JCM30237_21320 [Halolamina litorea]
MWEYMSPLQFAVPVGALESVAGELPYAILAFIVLSLVTRHFEYSSHERAVDDGAESLSRSVPHVVVSALAVAASFLYMIVHPHSGMVISVLVTGTVLTDFFEFESRLVEARNDLELERPKAAIAAGLLSLGYAAYISLFWIVREQWVSIV